MVGAWFEYTAIYFCVINQDAITQIGEYRPEWSKSDTKVNTDYIPIYFIIAWHETDGSVYSVAWLILY